MTLSYITEKAFLQEIKNQIATGNKRYCFILGAGASISSGIPSGQQLAERWFRDINVFNGVSISEPEKAFADEIDRRISVLEKATGKTLKMRYERFRDISYKPNTYDTLDDYSCLCELRFTGDREKENKYIQDIMDGKTPYIGYYALASIVDKTGSDRIITLNFDKLTEKALLDYTRCQFDVIAHEQIAHFADEQITGRPKILKVHRDYTTGCFNTDDLLQKLNPQWIVPLNHIFDNYIPIVIGYGGTDHTLMNYLENRKFGNIYWCHMYGELPNQRVRKMIESRGGKCVEIYEFDHVILELAAILCNDPEFSEMIVGDSFNRKDAGYFTYKSKKARYSLRSSTKDRHEKSTELYAFYADNTKKKASPFKLSSMLIALMGYYAYYYHHYKLAAMLNSVAFKRELKRDEYYGKARFNEAVALKAVAKKNIEKANQAREILEELIDKPFLKDRGAKKIKDSAVYHYIDYLLAIDGKAAKEKTIEYLDFRRCDGTFYRLLSIAELKLGELISAKEHIMHAIELHEAENNTDNLDADYITKNLIEAAIEDIKLM